MKILLIRTGKGKCAWADQAVDTWVKRFRNKIQFEEQILKPAPAQKTVAERQELESQKVQQFLKKDDYVIVLDERGALWSTEELHQKCLQLNNNSVPRIVFVIGGPFGHAPFLRTQADACLSLSKMVLNHEIARICLVEQFYRVYTLMYGGDYHH